MPKECANGIKNRKRDVAEKHMICAVPSFRPDTKLAEIERKLIEKSGEYDSIEYIYVTDDSNVLFGVVSLKELFNAPRKDLPIKDFMRQDLIVAHPQTDQERVVYLALSRGIKSVPVVDSERRLLGVVPHDAIVRIFNQEMHEDAFRFGGIFHRVGKEFSTISASPGIMIKSRLPWLLIGVLGGVATALIVSGFEEILGKFLVLASFIPVLVYLSGAAGMQTQTLIVRSLALDPKFPVPKYIAREFLVAGAISLVCGGALGAAALIGWQNPVLGAIVAIAMFVSMVCSISIATLLPLLFKKLKLDPAMSAGPFATMLSDMATIVIYFAVAVWIMNIAI